MEFLCYCLFIAGIVAADQITKALVVARIALYADVPFLPGILQLTYVQNNGAAFSSFSGQQWLFALIFLVFTGLILWEYFRKKAGFTPFERWCTAFCNRKYNSDFAREMSRSVEEYLAQYR